MNTPPFALKRETIVRPLALTVLFFAITIHALPTKLPSHRKELSNAMDYLHQFGYIEMSSGFGNLIDGSILSKAIKKMQRFAGLNETGELDPETKALMNSTRCGVPDFHSDRTRRYAIHHWKWPKRVLTWRIHNYGNDGIPKTVIRRTFKKAVGKWANATNLSFRMIHSGEPDIWFKFAVGAHGDNSPFKRPWDGVIAHAYYPKHKTAGLAGDVHFNDDKKFTVNSYKGKNLPWVALHEIGHSIGMEHSKVKGSIMFPYYQSYNGKESELTRDDISGIQALYGVKTNKPNPTPKVPIVSKCLGKINAAFLAADKRVYIFSGRKLFILKQTLEIEKGPISIWKIFKGIISVDAAFRRHDGNTVLFTKNVYHVYNDKNQFVSGPHYIKASFAGLKTVRERIDAAFVWPMTNALYIIKGNEYWRYFPILDGKAYGLVPGYPKLIQKSWRRVPKVLDAALTWVDGVTYLFKGTKYYRLTEKFTVPDGYPKLISNRWARSVNCKVESHHLTEETNLERSVASKVYLQFASVFSILIFSILFIF